MSFRFLTVANHDGVTTVLELRTYSRATAPGYDAVSYALGEDFSMVPLLCNGQELRIRKDLFNALPHIHKWMQGPLVPLWIDVICIYLDRHRTKYRRNFGFDEDLGPPLAFQICPSRSQLGMRFALYNS